MPTRAGYLSLPCLLLCASACSSIDWRPRPTEDLWHGRSLWCTEQVTVAASAGDAAAEGVAAWERVHAAFVALGEAPPPAPLFVVLGPEEQLLPGDPTKALDQLRDWHRQIVADESMPAAMAMGTPSDASPEMIAGMVRLVPAAIPLAAADLGMPASWQRISAWGMVVPAEATIVAVTNLMIDEGMKQQGIGFGKRLLMAPFMPWLRGAIRDSFREVSVRQLVDASCSPRVLGRPCSPELKNALLGQLGLPPTMQPMQPPKAMQPPPSMPQHATDPPVQR